MPGCASFGIGYTHGNLSWEVMCFNFTKLKKNITIAAVVNDTTGATVCTRCVHLRKGVRIRTASPPEKAHNTVVLSCISFDIHVFTNVGYARCKPYVTFYVLCGVNRINVTRIKERYKCSLVIRGLIFIKLCSLP